MSFRITPNDVGRKVRLRNGYTRTVVDYEHDSPFPVVLECKEGLRWKRAEYGLFSPCPFDIIAWADEPAIDQVADQNRPKDLRDEFAMVALASMVPSEGYRLAHKDTQSTVDEMAVLAYLFADSMMKARGK